MPVLPRETPSQILFLPGATGNAQFWRPVAARIPAEVRCIHIEYPGFGAAPAKDSITNLEGLLAFVVARIDRPTALVAQSVGGVLAVLAALKVPKLVTQLVLTVTSGGINTGGLGAEDWRPKFVAKYPELPRWLTDVNIDLSERLCEIQVPVMLLWGGLDPISPVSVGERLAALLPDATLHVVAEGRHDLACKFADCVAPLILRHLFGRIGASR